MPNCPHCKHELTPSEIGALYAAVGRTLKSPSRRWGVKLTRQDVKRIRKSKKTIWELAKKYNVSFATIWRVRENLTHTGQKELNCPHCRHKLTPKQINRFFASLGGSTWRPRKRAAPRPSRPKQAKLTKEDVANIQTSNAPQWELAKKYKVHQSSISRVKRYGITRPRKD